MTVVCPTIMPTSDDAHVFRNIMERLGGLGPRIQIDLMDGQFAPHRNTEPSNLWWPDGVKADIHLMYLHPEEALGDLLQLQPHLIILHAEAEGDLTERIRQIQSAGVKAGVALLRASLVEDYKELIRLADHVLLFGGELGGDGAAELSALDKVAEVRALFSNLSDDEDASVEIGWDGGANQDNIRRIADAGIDVINVGGALRKAEDPSRVYQELCQLLD